MLGDDPFAAVLLAATLDMPWTEAQAKLDVLVQQAKRGVDSLPEVVAGLVAARLRDSTHVTGFVGGILRELSKCAEPDREVLRFEGLRELEPNSKRVENSGDKLHKLHELHAHFRGSIPFDDLWSDWMRNARSRAMWRREILPCGETRARRLEKAACARSTLAKVDPDFDEQRLPKQILDDLESGTARCVAVRYLLLLINTRRAFLVRRRHTGLALFTDAYDRVSKASKRRWQRDDTRARVRDVCRQFEHRGCESLELRPTLKETRRQTQAALRSLVLGYLDYVRGSDNPLAMGLVCSFFKQEGLRGKGVAHGQRDDARVLERLNSQQRIWTRQAEALVAILGDVPAIRTFVVGVDAAGRERGCPCRFLAAPYEVIGDYNRRYNLGMRRGRDLDVGELQRRVSDRSPDAVWDSLNRESPTSRFGSRVRLGFTVHVGEDFVDPLTGLREVWEAVQHLKLKRGDRIGHGLVLALRPKILEDWVQSRQSGSAGEEFHKPAGVHALDMAWAYGCGISARESELELSRAVVDAVGGMPLFAAVRPALASSVPPVGVPLLGVSFFDPDAPSSSVMTRVVVDEAWGQRFEILRARVEDFIVRRGIVIESCPSSNCVIAGLDTPPLLSLLENESLRVVVGTDDPGIFEAWPDQELGRLDAEPQRDRVHSEAERSSFVRRIWKMSQYPHLQQLRARVARSPGHVVLVVGAGVTIGALGDHRCVAHATWRGLLGHGLCHAAGLNLIDPAEHQALLAAISSSSADPEEMVRAGDRLVEALGGPDGGAYRAWLEEVFMEFDRRAKRTAVIEQIAALHGLGVRIATTNYDGVLERFLGIESVPWQDGPAAEGVLAGRRDAVLHLHGHWRSPQSVVLGNSAYERLLADPQNERLMQAVRTLGTMVFVGMGTGLTDPNFRRLRAWASEALRESSGTHYWLVRRGEQGSVSPTELRDERTTPVVYDEFDELPEVLRKLRAVTPSPSRTNEQPRHILLLLNVRVKGARKHLDAGLVRDHGNVELAEEDVIAVAMDGDDEQVADPRWWEEVGENVRSAVEQWDERATASGTNVVLVVAGHAPISVFAYAGHLLQQKAYPVLFVNESQDKTSWDVIHSRAKDPRRADYELDPASDDSLQPLVPRHAVFASAGKIPGSKGELCRAEQFESLKGQREPARARGVAGLSVLVPQARPDAQDSPGAVSVGWQDIAELVFKVATELVRLGGKLDHSRGVVAYLGPTWGAFELGRLLRPDVHGDVEVPHFSKSRDKYLPALTLLGVREPVWFRQPRFLLLGAEPFTETRARVATTTSASAQALKAGGFSGDDVVQWDGNVRLDTMHDRIVRFKPHVVQVLAHGNEDGALGLIGPTDDARLAGADELVDAFCRSTVRPVLIVLLVCDSSFLGERLLHAADHVVVSENRLDIRNAEAFSARFFALLAEGDSIHDAFETAKRVAVANCPPAALRLLSNPAVADPRRVYFHRR